MTDLTEQSKQGEKVEKWLNEQLTGDWATGNLETDLRMAVSTIRDMGNIPKDYAVQPLLKLITRYGLEREKAGIESLIPKNRWATGAEAVLLNQMHNRLAQIASELEGMKA